MESVVLLEISAEREISSPPEAVWTQCTTARGIEKWWSPEDLRTKVRRWEARPNGSISLSLRYLPAMLDPKSTDAFRAAGVPVALDFQGRVLEFDPVRKLVLELTLNLGRGGAGITSRTVLNFEATPVGTRVKLSVLAKDEPHLRTLGETNLKAQLERLAASLEVRNVPAELDRVGTRPP